VFVNDGTLRVEQDALLGFGAGTDAVTVTSPGTLETTGVVDMNRPLIVNVARSPSAARASCA
jgi:hypothetical protein